MAHPDLVPVCQEVFDGVLGSAPNQLDAAARGRVSVTAEQLLDITATPGDVTEAGLRDNVYGGAAVPRGLAAAATARSAIYNLMEDAATAEISRSQIWQWVHNDVKLDDGAVVTAELVRQIVDEELAKIRESYGDAFDEQRFGQARQLFEQVALSDDYEDFLTIPAYGLID